jgi:hypothetical protein
MEGRTSIFNVGLLDDLHTYFPDILYNPGRFTTVQELLTYIQDQTRARFNLFDRGRRLASGVTPQPSVVGQPTAQPSIIRPPTPQPVRQSDTGGTSRTHLRYTLPLSSIPTSTLWLDDYVLHNNSSTNLLNLLFSGLNNQEPVVVHPSRAQIEAATTVETTTTALEDPCAICQEAMGSGSIVRKINDCQHTFHKSCIDTWFQRSVNCPNCRVDIRETD